MFQNDQTSLDQTVPMRRFAAQFAEHCCVVNRCLWVLFVTLPSFLASTTASAADLNGYVNLTSDYIYRGVGRSDSHGSIQLGADLSFNSGFYLGAWASTIDIGNGVTAQRDREINYYVGYVNEVTDRWTIGGSIVAYAFPGSFGNLDYDHEEVIVSANYDDRLWFEYAHSPDYYGTGTRTHNYEIFAEWPLPELISLSAGVGYYDVEDFSGSGYSHWQLGISRPFGEIGVDLRYHDTSRWVPRVSDPRRADARIVLSARYQF